MVDGRITIHAGGSPSGCIAEFVFIITAILVRKTGGLYGLLIESEGLINPQQSEIILQAMEAITSDPDDLPEDTSVT